MGGASPEIPSYGQDPLNRAIGGVDIRGNFELAESARAMVQEIGMETPDVAEKIIAAIQELRAKIDPKTLPQALRLLSAMHEAVTHNIESHERYADWFDGLADRVIETIQEHHESQKKETLH